MNTNANTGVDEAEQWRARILRALAELRRHDDSRGAGAERSDARERRDDDASNAGGA